MSVKKKKVRKSTDKITEQPINRKHDKGYKRVFSRNRNFLHFLKKYIKNDELNDWVSDIDENDLIPINTELIDKEFKKRESDVIYRMKFKDREIIFYVLLELQSSVDYTMPFRLLRYMMLILNYIFENTPANERESKDYRLPAIVPIILYNGADNWTAVKTFKEYLQYYEQFGKYIMDFEYYLLDIRRMADETILSTKQILDIIFLLDKKDSREDIDETLLKIAAEHYRNMSDDDKEDMRNWLEYVWLSQIAGEKQKAEILENFEKGEVSDMNSGLSIALKKERLEGKEEAEKKAYEDKLKSIKNLIKMGLSNSQISEAMEISEEKVEKIRIKEA